ncbi:hypothetical protein [Chryseobacterium luquanense]|uniref:Secretion system C-terminal sorting domain-containing protein n=1 Tax=Chryseobacterium luquanense TaxID=2983766 RepID=A0ABT3Y4K9_9FLAO|nr:hypothetical protein [Chryseobacterium luquanense]MCX8533057.1 hypothetical protein [Chryseobacterium luquanense]
MIAPEYFNNHIAIEGEIIVKRVPNDTGSVLVWNSTTKKISTRTVSEIVSDLSLVTTNTEQNISGRKSFITSGGNDSINNSLWIMSNDGSYPAMTFYRPGIDLGQIKYVNSYEGFYFVNSPNSGTIPVTAQKFIKEGSDNNKVLLGGGNDKLLSDFALSSQVGGYLSYQDNRLIYPDEIVPQKLQFGFTSWNNDNNYPYADFLHLGGYQDSSGGNQNLLLAKRNGFGLRQFQSTWQGNNPYENYVDFWNTEHFTQGDINSWQFNRFNTQPMNFIGAGNDVNDITASGFYVIGHGTENAAYPLDQSIDGARMLLHLETEGIYTATQIQSERYSGNLVSRVKTDTGWSSWIRHWGNNDFTQNDINNWNYLAGNGATIQWVNKNAVHAINESEGDSMNFDTINGKTQTGSIYDGSTWWHALNIQHRNGLGSDGNIWGGQIRFGMNDSMDTFQFRQLYNGTYNSWKTLYHSGNFNPSNYWDKYSSGSFTGVNSVAPFSFLNNGQAQRIYTGGLLVSDAYSDANNITNNGIYAKGDISTGSNFNARAFYSPALNGGQVFHAGNSDTLYLGNPQVAALYLESSNNLLHNRPGYGVGVIWDAHNLPNPVNQSDLGNYIPNSQKGIANGIATLDGSGLVSASQLPSYVDDVLEFGSLGNFPTTGETGKIYVATDTNQTYRWSGSTYIQIASGAVQSINGQVGIVNLTKDDIGLGNVDNTADSVKNVAYARNATKLYSIDSTYDYNGPAPYYGSLVFKQAVNRWRFEMSPNTPAGIEVAHADNSDSFSGLSLSSFFKNNEDNTLKTIDVSNYNDVVDGNGKIWLGNFYSLPESTTGFQSSVGTILNINGLVAHDKTQLIFNGGNGSIQYRTSWYANTAWTAPRTLWDSNNFNPAQYVTQSSLNSQLLSYATFNGIQTFTNTNTFTQSPVIPNGTLGTHAVNLNQLNGRVQSWENARALGFSSGLSASSPYIYHETDGYVFLATQHWVTSQLPSVSNFLTVDTNQDVKSIKSFRLGNFNSGTEWGSTSNLDNYGFNVYVETGSDSLNNGRNGIGFYSSGGAGVMSGIIVRDNGQQGTSMALTTTDSYASGPKVGLTLSSSGVVDFNRAVPTIQGNSLTNIFITADTAPQIKTGNLSFGVDSEVVFNGNESNEVSVWRKSSSIDSIVSGHIYNFYNTRWKVGNKRGGSANSLGYSFEFSEDGGTTYDEKFSIKSSGDVVLNQGDLYLNQRLIINSNWNVGSIRGNQPTGNYLTWKKYDGSADIAYIGSDMGSAMGGGVGNNFAITNPTADIHLNPSNGKLYYNQNEVATQTWVNNTFATPTFIAQNYALRAGSNATDTWINSSNGLQNNPTVMGKMGNSGGQSNLADATWGQVAGYINTSGISQGNPTDDWYHRIKMLHNNGAGYNGEIAVQMTGGNSLQYRRMENGVDSGWVKTWDERNFNPLNYATQTDLLNYITIHTSQTIIAQKVFAGGIGNNYYEAALEVRGNGSTVIPGISFHQPGVVASQIRMDAGGQICIVDNPGSSYENFRARVITGESFTSTIHGNSSQWYDAYVNNHKSYNNNQYLGSDYTGGFEKPNSEYFGGGKVKLQMLHGANVGAPDIWNDALWISSYTGADVKKSTAIISSKYSNEIGFVKADFDSPKWDKYIKFWTSDNLNPNDFATQTWVNTNFIPKSHPVYNITQANINSWNAAAGGSFHTHSNLNLLNNIDQWLGVGQAPTFGSVRLMNYLGYGQLALEEGYIGNEMGLVDLDNKVIYAGRENEYLKYGSSVNGFEALNVHFEAKLLSIGKEITNDEDKVQVAGNISVDTSGVHGGDMQLILNPLYNNDGNVRDSRNAHIYIVTRETVILPSRPILGQRIEIFNDGESDIEVMHENGGTFFYLPGRRKITGIVGGKGFIFDEKPIPAKHYGI